MPCDGSLPDRAPHFCFFGDRPPRSQTPSRAGLLPSASCTSSALGGLACSGSNRARQPVRQSLRRELTARRQSTTHCSLLHSCEPCDGDRPLRPAFRPQAPPSGPRSSCRAPVGPTAPRTPSTSAPPPGARRPPGCLLPRPGQPAPGTPRIAPPRPRRGGIRPPIGRPRPNFYILTVCSRRQWSG